ncbi:hypothetical protein GH714_010703 [Hevea brasiliensis]|uniref:WRKY domain-containing protein n=1 Tax=Hevea brasiliensis TaxID=3981 RepID=A0A6A6MLJ7_HEVBR|nr:hypothetical protein GH714_010703 [Hevea brasiliensis]
MDNGETPPLPTVEDVLNFKPLLPLTSLLPPMATDQLGQDSQFGSDIDWISLLSSSFKIGDQNPSPPTAARDGENVGKNKKKGGRAKNAMPPRIAFHTRSVDDILDDGYRWRKYGQKAVKNSVHQSTKIKGAIRSGYSLACPETEISSQAPARNQTDQL